MLCNNCGKREANVKYTETINGKTKKLNLCEECSQKLGIGKINFDMPFGFSGIFNNLMDEFKMPELLSRAGEIRSSGFMPMINEFEDDEFTSMINDFENDSFTSIINNFENNMFMPFFENNKTKENLKDVDKTEEKKESKNQKKFRDKIGKKIDEKINNRNSQKENSNKSKKEILQEQLQKAIKEERYEDAAKLRDEIAKIKSE